MMFESQCDCGGGDDHDGDDDDLVTMWYRWMRLCPAGGQTLPTSRHATKHKLLNTEALSASRSCTSFQASLKMMLGFTVMF